MAARPTGSRLRERDLAIVDLETTGGSPVSERIIEIGILRIAGGEVIRRYSTLVDPERRIPEFIQQLTGITQADVEGAPTFRAVQETVRELLEDALFIAHNARFDYGFLWNEFQRLGRSFSVPCLCTVRLSRQLSPHEPRHDLDSLIARFQLPCARRHRALDDAEAVWAFLERAEQAFGPSHLASAVDILLQHPTLPPRLPAEALETLPRGPGVYVFYDGGGAPLYVGKSLRVRERVQSHFASGHRSGGALRLCQQVERIETHPAHGELGALLLESHLIKTLAPLHNRRARSARGLVAITRRAARRGYDTVRLEPLDALSLPGQGRVLGVFYSRRQALECLRDAASEQRLCPQVLGLERGRGRCLAAQLARCAGACRGADPPARFNARLATAFARRRIRTWPYRGAILIEERAPEGQNGHAFLVDEWRLLRALAYEGDGTRELLAGSAQFDYDCYKILAAHLLKHGRAVRRLSRREVDRLLSGEGADGREPTAHRVAKWQGDQVAKWPRAE